MILKASFAALLLSLVAFGLFARVQPLRAAPQAPPASQQPGAEPPSPAGGVQPPLVQEASQGPLKPPPGNAGYVDTAKLKSVLYKIRMTEYRINDLLTDVHLERWKLPEAVRSSLSQMLATLRAEVGALESWRGQLEQRPDSAYMAYQTYAAIDSVLTRLDGVSRAVSEHETPGFGAQYTQAGGKLFDLQQTIGAYVGFLLRNQDQVVLALENNLAGCQNSLGIAMRGSEGRAKPVKNSAPIRPFRRRTQDAAPHAAGIVNQAKQGKKPQPTPSAKQSPPTKPSIGQAPKPEQKKP